MNRTERRGMIDRDQPEVSVVRQCDLLNVSRSSVYYSPVAASEDEHELMGLMDKQYLRTPFYGSRKMAAWLRRQGDFGLECTVSQTGRRLITSPGNQEIVGRESWREVGQFSPRRHPDDCAVVKRD